jgi:transcriptional regulator with XRE-family HTH domain
MAKSKSVNSIDKHIGMRVRRTREFRGMSQEAFAAGLGLSLHQIKKFESGFERIGASQLAAICKSLQVRPSFFFADLKAKGGTTVARADAASNGADGGMVEDLSAALAALAEQKTLQNTPIFDLLRKLEAELRADRPQEI